MQVMASSLLLDRTPLPLPNPAAVLAEVSEGAVLYLPTTEHYFGLTPVAQLVWSLLPPVSATLGDVVRAMAERWPDVEVEILHADVAELLADLEKMGLVVAPTALNAER